jgi:hypothetical protein
MIYQLRQFRLREEPVEFYSELDNAEESFTTDFAETWQGELSRKGSDYIRWVQESLNKILGLRLAIDGIMGAQTRSAIRSFQKQAGLSADGRVGEKTEAAMIAKGAGAPPRSAAMPVIDPNRIKVRKHKTKPGYIAYGGGSTTTVLRQLKNQGRIDISDGDIEMFHRMSNVETGGVIQGINSWDSAYMSMGFMQWPVLYDDKHGGKLQRLIQMVPEAFKRYGIELSNEKYAIRRKYGTEYSWKIKGAPSPEDLRSEIWAKRFYLAGLDPEVIVAEAKLTLTLVREGLQKMILFAKQKTGDGQLFERIRAAYDNSPMLRALIQEAYNYRPAHTQVALKNAMLAVRSGIGAEELIGVLRQKLREAFPQDADSQRGVDHIITKTAQYPPGTEHEFEFDQENLFGADNHEYEADEKVEAGSLEKYPDPVRFSPACDRSVATPGFLVSKRKSLVSLLSPSQNARAVLLNREIHQAKSGVQPADIVTDLKRYVDFDAVRGAIRRQSGGSIVLGEGTVDAVFVEAVHQFQAKVYFDKTAQDGVAGPSTLDSLGIVKHNLRRKIDRAVFGQGVLNKISAKVSALTNGEFSAKNWYDFIVAPSFLGHRINKFSQGIHLLLVRKLREAENYLLSLPAYTGMTPVELGRALGLDRPTVHYSGGRISAEPQGMHGVGLALDIDVVGNPWIGAGWIMDDKKGRDWLVEQIKTNPDGEKKRKYQRILNMRNERYRFVETLKSAAQKSLNGAAKGSTIASFLHVLAVKHGRDTRTAHQILARWNEEFKTYLRNKPSELRYWKNSATFDNRDPLNGFLNLHPGLVLALRQKALLAWGAIDFGPLASGDVMHFDLRTLGAGRVIAEKLGGYVPRPGHHPVG